MINRSAPGIRLVSLASERARGGTPIELSGRVLKLTFEDDDRKVDKVSLELDNSDLSLFDRGDLSGGALWEVSWGYLGAMAPARRVVVRKVTGFEALTVEAHSLGVLLDNVARTRTFSRMTRGQVAAAIAREHGYDGSFVDVELDGPVEDTIVQAAESDARFVRRLADRDHRLFFVDAAGFHFRRRRPARQVSHTFAWRADASLISLHVDSNLAGRVGAVEVRAHDPMTKETVTGKATKDTVTRVTLGEIVEVVDPETGKTAVHRRIGSSTVQPGSSASRAKADADAHFLGAEGATVRLSAQVVGDPSLVAGSLVAMRQISKRLSGTYHLRTVRHVLGGETYVCDLGLVRDGFSRSNTGANGQPQGGQHANPPAAKVDALVPVEQVDRETGRTQWAFRKDSLQ